MIWLNKQKFFSRYLPMFLSVVLVVVALATYQILRPQTQTAQASWYNTGGTWNYRKVLTINHNYIASSTAETYVNFPVLVSLTDPNLATYASSSGADILFTLNDGKTKLAHEIETYSSSTGALLAWVNIGANGLSTSTDTSLYMYYGNASATNQQNVSGTWNSNYDAVWHLPNGTTLGLNDSTSYANNLTASGTPSATAGQIDGAASVSPAGYATRLESGSASLQLGTNSFSVSLWEENNDASAADPWVQIGTGSASQPDIRFWYAGNTGGVQARVTDGTTSYLGNTSSTIKDGLWHYAVMTVDKTGLKIHLYIDGVEAVTATTITTLNSVSNATGCIIIDSESNGANCTNFVGTPTTGKLDEVRVNTGANSVDWIKTEYNNQFSPSTFLSEGLVQNNPAGVAAPNNRGVTVENAKVKIQNAKVKIQASH